MTETTKTDLCAHEPCTCTVAAGADYCSDHCRVHASQESQQRVEGGGEPEVKEHGTCGCGHPGCR
jgi:hypothetical protein